MKGVNTHIVLVGGSLPVLGSVRRALGSSTNVAAAELADSLVVHAVQQVPISVGPVQAAVQPWSLAGQFHHPLLQAERSNQFLSLDS